MPATIETMLGQLILDFENIRFALDTGQLLDYETIEKTSKEYWTELAGGVQTSREPTT